MVDPLEQGTQTITHPTPSTPGGDVVVESDKLSGGVYKGAIPSTGPWRCPRCSVENAGPISAGCQSCGSGSAQPRHVGVPPVPKGKGLGKIGVDVETERPAAVIVNQEVDPRLAFDGWFERRFTEPESTALGRLKPLFQEAWQAALLWHWQQMRAVEPEAPVVDTVAVPRPLVEKFIQILEGTIELSEDDALMLISQLRERLE